MKKGMTKIQQKSSECQPLYFIFEHSQWPQWHWPRRYNVFVGDRGEFLEEVAGGVEAHVSDEVATNALAHLTIWPKQKRF